MDLQRYGSIPRTSTQIWWIEFLGSTRSFTISESHVAMTTRKGGFLREIRREWVHIFFYSMFFCRRVVYLRNMINQHAKQRTIAHLPHVCLPHPEWPKLFEGAITMWKGTLWINVDKRTFLIMRFYSVYIVMKHVFVPVLSISRMFHPWFRFSGCCFYIMAPIWVYICPGVWGWIIGELNGNRHVHLS